MLCQNYKLSSPDRYSMHNRMHFSQAQSSVVIHWKLFNSGIDEFSTEGYVIEQIYQCKPNYTELFFYRTQAGAEC